MISERKLKNWRGEALKEIELDPGSNKDVLAQLWAALTASRKGILSMTQELLDQSLLNKNKEKQNEKT